MIGRGQRSRKWRSVQTVKVLQMGTSRNTRRVGRAEQAGLDRGLDSANVRRHRVHALDSSCRWRPRRSTGPVGRPGGQRGVPKAPGVRMSSICPHDSRPWVERAGLSPKRTRLYNGPHSLPFPTPAMLALPRSAGRLQFSLPSLPAARRAYSSPAFRPHSSPLLRAHCSPHGVRCSSASHSIKPVLARGMRSVVFHAPFSHPLISARHEGQCASAVPAAPSNSLSSPRSSQFSMTAERLRRRSRVCSAPPKTV